jgi:hypothetical protein
VWRASVACLKVRAKKLGFTRLSAMFNAKK